MTAGSVDQNFLFTVGELYRMLRVFVDKEAARFGITRAQWAVLTKIAHGEGLKQSELADLLEMQPITLTRLVDKLCEHDWIERRGDCTDRRVNRLYLRQAGRELLIRMKNLSGELTARVLEGMPQEEAERLLAQLRLIKENMRNAIQNTGMEQVRKGAVDHG
ncbi:MAG: MarR family winged helix-turn-helix transcriptional regulator [Alphaproteobacteria bacterium]|nr:MarR family winged helix-turn-helix transcriptional regulator [Alphaproteobacteria bacterium]